MNYVDRNLRNGEEVVVKAKISFLYLVPRILILIIGIVVAVVLTKFVFKDPTLEDLLNGVDNYLVKKDLYPNLRTACWVIFPTIGAFMVLQRLLIMATTHLVVTNKRVVGKIGILRIKTLDVPIDKLDSVSFDGNVLGNLLHYYNVKVGSAGNSGYIFPGISNAQQFKDCANDAIEKHAEQARKDQAEQIAMAMHGSRSSD